jgi:hypothetical protein
MEGNLELSIESLMNILNRSVSELVPSIKKIRKKLVIFVHFKGFNISQKPKSSPLYRILHNRQV